MLVVYCCRLWGLPDFQIISQLMRGSKYYKPLAHSLNNALLKYMQIKLLSIIADCYNRVCQRVFFLYDALEPEISYCRTKDCDIFSALLELFFWGRMKTLFPNPHPTQESPPDEQGGDIEWPFCEHMSPAPDRAPPPPVKIWIRHKRCKRQTSA